MKEELQPSLPDFRVSDDFAFTQVGVDFAGPVYAKPIFSKGTKSPVFKTYICLFTCASSRALHLELVPDLSTKAFIRCLQRFMSRRGIPKMFISDNGKTFKANELAEFATRNNISWKFNIERAPRWGGFFERLVKSVKRCLRKIVRRARLTYEESETVLVEIECVINSHPLTYVHSDEVCEGPLTPSHLVMGRRLLSQAPVVRDETDTPAGNGSLSRRATYLKKLLEHFWKRWSREYLLELREDHRVKGVGRSAKANPKEGDIV